MEKDWQQMRVEVEHLCMLTDDVGRDCDILLPGA